MNASPLTEDQGEDRGTLYGVGLGPGDPDLMTLRAARVIASVPVVAFHAAQHGRSIARSIAAPHLRPEHVEELLIYPVTAGRTDHPGECDGALADFHTQSARRLAGHLQAGRDVAVLVAGDPGGHSSFQHLDRRLRDRFRVEVVPGVTSATAAGLQQPLCEADKSPALLSGTDSELPEPVHRVEPVTLEDQQSRPLADVDEAPSLSPASTGRGEVIVVGMGPGPGRWLTPAARSVLAWADDIVGYAAAVDRVPVRPGQRRHPAEGTPEAERAETALALATRGHRVVVVTSGDPGVFAMASTVLEAAGRPAYADVPVRVEPGMTAAQAVASRVGAPLAHDFVTISLSDRLKPWSVVEGRLRIAAEGDFVMALYNPASGDRRWQVERVQHLLLEYRAADTPLVVGRAVGSPDEEVTVTILGDFDPAVVDTRALLIIGSSQTSVIRRPGGQLVWTPRRYL